MARLDSKLESEGAEFLVLGALLIERINANKSYRNTPGYDLVATNPRLRKSCTIQVKSRWATDSDGGFLIKNMGSDFVVFVALNRGYRYSKPKKGEAPKLEPVFYVFPIKVLKKVPRTKGWGRLFLHHIPNHENFRGRWELIKEHLEVKR